MSSLAEFIPIELVNHILSFRPRHPDACLIKEFKDKIFRKADLVMNSYTYEFYYNETFKELHNKLIRYHNYKIFSSCIRPNSIYKIKTKKHKTSEGFYWGKYYTEKKAYEELEEAKKSFCYCGDIYSIELVNIDNDSLDEHTVLTYYQGDSEEEYYDSDNSDDGYEEEEEFKKSDSESEEED